MRLTLGRSTRLRFYSAVIATAALSSAAIAQAPMQSAVSSSSNNSGKPLPAVLFTDVTKIKAEERKSQFLPQILKHLPNPVWLDVSIDANQRVETNILQTSTNPQTDYVFRAQPSCDIGCNLQQTEKSSTAVYTTYQVVKDVYAVHSHLTNPTNQLVGVGAYRRFKVGYFNWLQLDCQARENWQGLNSRQANLLPAVYFTRIRKPEDPVWFGSVILQMVSHVPFEGATNEIDPAYSLGVSKQIGSVNCQLSDTFITNFRHPPFGGSTPNNEQMILELDVVRPFEQLPLLSAYTTIQSVWNWGAGAAPGLGGYDFRCFTGLRYGFSKRPFIAMKRPVLNSQ
jgi:hypothetical protein